MNTTTVAADTAKTSMIKAFALRAGNSSAFAAVKSTFSAAGIQSAGARLTGWAKSAAGVNLIAGLLSSKQVLKSLANAAFTGASWAGRLLRWAAKKTVEGVDALVEGTTFAISLVSETGSVRFDKIAKPVVDFLEKAVDVTSDTVADLFRALRHVTTSPFVLTWVSRVALTVFTLRWLQFALPSVMTPVLSWVAKLWIVGPLVATATGAGWAPLIVIGSAAMILIGLALFSYAIKVALVAYLNNVEAEFAEAADDILEAAQDTLEAVLEPQDAVFVTANGVAMTESEAKEYADRIVPRHRPSKNRKRK